MQYTWRAGCAWHRLLSQDLQPTCLACYSSRKRFSAFRVAGETHGVVSDRRVAAVCAQKRDNSLLVKDSKQTKVSLSSAKS